MVARLGQFLLSRLSQLLGFIRNLEVAVRSDTAREVTATAASQAVELGKRGVPQCVEEPRGYRAQVAGRRGCARPRRLLRQQWQWRWREASTMAVERGVKNGKGKRKQTKREA